MFVCSCLFFVFLGGWLFWVESALSLLCCLLWDSPDCFKKYIYIELPNAILKNTFFYCVKLLQSRFFVQRKQYQQSIILFIISDSNCRIVPLIILLTELNSELQLSQHHPILYVCMRACVRARTRVLMPSRRGARALVMYKCNSVMKIHDESMLTALATLRVPAHE